MVCSNKSKAVAKKSLKRANKVLDRIIRNKHLYIKLAESDDDKGNSYIEKNFNEKDFVRLNDKLEVFKEEFENTGGNADQFEGLVMGSIFLDRDLLKDMIKTCK